MTVTDWYQFVETVDRLDDSRARAFALDCAERILPAIAAARSSPSRAAAIAAAAIAAGRQFLLGQTTEAELQLAVDAIDGMSPEVLATPVAYAVSPVSPYRFAAATAQAAISATYAAARDRAWRAEFDVSGNAGMADKVANTAASAARDAELEYQANRLAWYLKQ